ncbi:TonB family protein [Halioxenophilus aromaticivorans]|uniref:TonB C-terminal domain-containing protein n=1 Tax=Halioxenophilus aromaticivorans TaxID=1306992 RepID=A0AAV3U0B0_9ALTE
MNSRLPTQATSSALTLFICYGFGVLLLIGGPAALAWDNSNYARFSQYNRPVFIALLQRDANSAGDQSVLSGAYPFRLDLAIEAEYFSDRRFARLWRESIGLNSNTRQQQDESQALAKLYQFLDQDFYRGDHFRVVYTPGRGTSLQINMETIEFIDNSQLGVLMLNGLLGDVPLSSEFKRDLLEDNNGDSPLVAEFLALQPSAVESQAVLASAPVAASAAAEPEEPVPAQVGSVRSILAPERAPTNAPARQPQTLPDPAATAPAVMTEATTPSPASADVIGQTESEAVADVGASAQVATVQTGNSNAAVNTPTVVAAATVAQEPNTEDKEAATAAKRAYQSQLERAIRKYQTIPFKAFSRRMEGDVSLHIAVDDKGYLTRLDLAKPSRYDVLNDQALDAVASAEPFTPIPENLGLKEFSFELTLTYDLVY